MRLMVSLSMTLLLVACSHGGAPKPSGAFDAAPGVTHAAGSPSDRSPRVVPLRPIPGDVEILHGDPEKPGEPFVMRIRELPGTIIPLHFHPVDEHITVVEGTWYFTVGDKWDRSALKELRVGDYAFAPKGSTMYGYCPEGAIVQVHGIGPFLIHWMHGSKTLGDPDASKVFTFNKGDRIETPRGPGVIRQGYASGDIVQYEVEAEGGNRFMASQHEVRRP